MTIFDKLSGYAQKAKENVVGRAILAKDKRLERSLSDSIDAANVGLLKVAWGKKERGRKTVNGSLTGCSNSGGNL